ncbi:helix-turn-helix domain-containing protein [Comamonas piscis]|uniref:Helix-turn-helix domain-containing protein n=1 Tax=Comamonas piscis TaxID=1562974 RepID=A0A7G5EKU2_9BURK|nr:helix-turn-helix domain-containing protein [Comamonas piscis]QMV74617.1 helix-turn-helix domain-containing protein [Comamonas piscis]WSO33078.1 helix-turn-helix domain-containing protein [Comamonas piscis]
MQRPVPLSSKLAATAEYGFALRQSRQPKYSFDWHIHDCAMLLWPQIGALESCWVSAPGADTESLQLVRHTALLLPASAAHSTRSRAMRQRHGELYLRPELLGQGVTFGILQLDGAAFAMLEALSSPTLTPRAGEPLIDAVMKQLRTLRPAQKTLPREQKLSQRMIGLYYSALDAETAMPTVETVALKLGVSARQLERACAVELGVSPVMVRRRLVAARARELLAQGIPTSLVSQQLCFSHSGHLTRLLREVPA